MKSLSLVAMCHIAAAALSGNAASAAVVASNLSAPDNEFAHVAHVPAAAPPVSGDVAYSFTAGSAASLSSITLRIGRTGRDQIGTGFSVYLASDQGGLPGSFLANLSGSSAPLTPGFYTYSATSTISLAAGSSYWVVMTVPHSSGDPLAIFNPILTTSSAQSGLPGWSVGMSYAEQIYLDGSLFIPWRLGTLVTSSGTSPYRGILEVDADVIPTPAATGAFVVAGIAAALKRRRP